MAETFELEWVRCGKRTCKSCPHGPYWYAYWREGEKVRKRYVGKQDPRPGATGAAAGAAGPTAPPDWREAINSRATASESIACRILGVSVGCGRDVAYRAWRALQMRHHPDRGGDAKEIGYVNAAFSWLKARHGW